MTLIVGIESAGGVHIAADSGGWNAYEATLTTPKVFRVGPVLVGSSGTLRGLNILRHCVEPPEMEPGSDPERYMVRHFVPALRAALEEHGGGKQGEGGLELGGSLLVACGGRLYEVGEGFEVARTDRGYAATGYGAAIGVALGVLWGTADLPPAERLQRALEAAEEHTDGVRRPWRLEALEPAPAADAIHPAA